MEIPLWHNDQCFLGQIHTVSYSLSFGEHHRDRWRLNPGFENIEFLVCFSFSWLRLFKGPFHARWTPDMGRRMTLSECERIHPWLSPGWMMFLRLILLRTPVFQRSMTLRSLHGCDPGAWLVTCVCACETRQWTLHVWGCFQALCRCSLPMPDVQHVAHCTPSWF